MTTNTTQQLGSFYDEFTAYHSQCVPADKSELTTILSNQLKELQEIPFPHKKQEDWRYTNIKKKLLENYKIQKLSGKMSEAALQDVPSNYPHFIFINGKLSKLLSKNLNGIKFLHLDPLDDAHFIERGAIRFKSSKDFCDSLNLSTLKEGIQLHITQENCPTSPIAISHIFTAECENNIISPRFSIKVDNNLKIEVIEHFQYKALQESSFTLNNLSEITLEQGASMEYVQIQNTTAPILHLNTIKGNLYKDANINLVNLTYGGELTRNNYFINLQESGAEALLNGLFHLSDKQHSDQNIVVNHNAPSTESHQLFKGILDGSAHGVFTGRVHVAKNSLLVNSTQVNNNLLLSTNAHIDTRPQLEIFADDVKCTHGATIGQLDDEQIFYLETRGINRKKAKEMVSKGFGEDILFKIKNEELQTIARSLV